MSKIVKLTDDLTCSVETAMDDNTGKYANYLCFNGKRNKSSQVFYFDSKNAAEKEAEEYLDGLETNVPALLRVMGL
ncbi:MAG: hypothetical protein JWO15_3549 [Sphingomonadales bacterium]|nr:hypothetical protein [Sphingomonadales bacterium]